MLSRRHVKKRNIGVSKKELFSVVFIVVLLLAFGGQLVKGFRFVFSPLVSFAYYMDESIKMKYLLRSKKDLLAIIEELAYKNGELTYLAEENEVLRNENEQLKNLSNESEGTLARVIARPTHTPYDTLKVDIYLNDDSTVTEGQGVYLYGGYLLGFVEDVNGRYATVSLLSAPQNTVSAYLNKKGISVELVGRGNGSFEVVLPRGTDLSEEDVAVMDGYETYVVAMHPKKISEQASSLDVYLLTAPLSLKELSWVLIK